MWHFISHPLDRRRHLRHPPASVGANIEAGLERAPSLSWKDPRFSRPLEATLSHGHPESRHVPVVGFRRPVFEGRPGGVGDGGREIPYPQGSAYFSGFSRDGFQHGHTRPA
ncbi:hypothetical protein ZHAS_00004366 [Anopheles sinensis]|uniref:Uncharacterized protein n=1 Tax=Anopheles sinensis TaxID=74873 RepID=A0A084VGR5_ANOSI|nr:hypothetical protein ZHAS_00004366 [Anopheles sinensis]